MITSNMLFKELVKTQYLKYLAADSYYAALDRVNRGPLDAFNINWETEGKEFGTKEYVSACEQLFEKIWMQEIEKIKGKYSAEEIRSVFGEFKIITEEETNF